MIKLLDHQIKTMLSQPETGMGYQLVEVDMVSGLSRQTKGGTVLNGELLLFADEPRNRLVASHEVLMESASIERAHEIRSIRVVSPHPQLVGGHTYPVSEKAATGQPATEGNPRLTERGDRFLRFCAYRRDRRITSDNGLVPGTYATTRADGLKVKTGEEAVERYALPNPKPANHRFSIDPHKDTVYHQGIVQPAYGHQGGGVEVFFDDGTQPNTVWLETTLPER